MHIMNHISYNDFEKIDIRTGTILEAEIFKNAIKPAYILKIDFGDLGIKRSSAQITKLYLPQDLIGRQVVAVVNFPPKQIANFYSECLVLGAIGENGIITVISPQQNVKNGLRVL